MTRFGLGHPWSELRQNASHSQHPFGIFVCDLGAVTVTDRKFVEEGHAYRVGLVGPVNREQNLVGAKRKQRANKSRLVPIAAGAHQKIIANVFKRCFFKSAAFASVPRMLVEPYGAMNRARGAEFDQTLRLFRRRADAVISGRPPNPRRGAWQQILRSCRSCCGGNHEGRERS